MKEISGLLIAGLLAILGTVAGGVIQGYMDTQLAASDFQSKLILRALEPNDVSERIKSLEFLVDAKLISNPEVEAGLKDIIAKGEDGIPQFQPANVLPQNDSGEGFTPSVKPPQLKNSLAPLVAVQVKYGDIIDAITPVFAELAPDLSVKNKVMGNQYGGESGDAVLLEQEGYVITGIDVYRGTYFGKKEIIHIQIIWHRLTLLGIDSIDKIISEKLGSGNFAEDVHLEQLHAKLGYYIDDFNVESTSHTDGTKFLGDINITQKELPLEN